MIVSPVSPLLHLPANNHKNGLAGLLAMLRSCRGLLVAACWFVPVGPVIADSKPRLEDFKDYSSFSRAWDVWKRDQLAAEADMTSIIRIVGRDKRESANSVPSTSSLQELTAASAEMNESLAPGYHPPITVTGPENLAVAVEQAKHFVHPVYKTRLRYNRTHFNSFPLRQADIPALEDAVAGSMLLADIEHPHILNVLHLLMREDNQRMAELFGGQQEKWTILPEQGVSALAGAARGGFYQSDFQAMHRVSIELQLR